jgi:general stress protein 26
LPDVWLLLEVPPMVKNNAPSHSDDVQKLAELIKEIKFAMLTTVEPDGSLRSRPMATQNKPFDGTLWFFTEINSGKVSEIQKDHQVNVSYADTDAQKYVSVSGVANVIQDRARAEEFWSPAYRAWFPEGLDDPSLALLKIEVTQAEYWDAPHSAVMRLAGFVKALATGEKYEPGENRRLDIDTPAKA